MSSMLDAGVPIHANTTLSHLGDARRTSVEAKYRHRESEASSSRLFGTWLSYAVQSLRINGRVAVIEAPYQTFTDDGTAVLALGVIAIRPTDSVLNDALVFFERRCAAPPGPPAHLRVASNHDRTVARAWEPSAGGAVKYLLEAGTAPGLANVSSNELSASTSVTVPDVRPGTYYARVRAMSACGTGAPSNEIVVVP